MRHRRLVVLLPALCLPVVLFLEDCRGKKPNEHGTPPLRVIRIDVQDRTARPQRIMGLDADTMRDWLRERLHKTAEVKLEEGGAAAPGAYRLALELGIGERSEEEEGATAGRAVVASLRGSVPGNGEGVELQASTVKPLPRATSADEVSSVRRIVEGLVDDVLFQAKLAVGPAQLVVQALGERKDIARLSAAVEIAGVRRVRETVPALIQLLQHKDEQVADRAIGALVAIGDRAAVKPLTRLASFQDTARMAKVLDAIGSLGGQEAKDYLEFVSTGHEDADIRNLASEALERMNRAQPSGQRNQK